MGGWNDGGTAPTLAVLPDANGLLRPNPAQQVAHGRTRQLFDSVHYVFIYLRGRLDADARRRRLAEEREGAARLVSGALAELGQAVLGEGVNSPELTGLLEAVGRAQAQRETALAEISSTETFRAAEEIRLGDLETHVRAELHACEKGVEEAERALRQLEDERRKLAGPSGGAGTGAGVGGVAKTQENAATELRRAHLDQQYDATRERAAALRAAGLAARAKLDQATAARRQALAALAASITGHARERAEAEGRIQELQTQIGRISWHLRIPDQRLISRYERLDRHQQTITERDRQIAMVEKLAGRYDRRKLGIGIGVLAGIVLVATLLLGVLIR
jgi:DNA repair exonuclease SbcCD ATPase subunit